MNLRERWSRWRKRPRRQEASNEEGPTKADLREFVYLDEVSLRSLLSSLKGDLRESRSEQISDELQAEVATALEASNPLIGKAELSSRFQTTNSSSIQTSRKATVQSWFRDLHRVPNLKLIEVTKTTGPAADAEALVATSDASLVSKSDDLSRGELVEFRVRLTADPVYQLSTMVSEFTGMASDYPEMFSAGSGTDWLQEAQPVNKILERLLAGLVPIRAVAVDYSVVTIDGTAYVAHNDLLQGLGLEKEPLYLVGVTEHLAYWRDLRRVLFSDAEFTLLGRISRSGLQRSWTPVKLAELFSELVPDLIGQINAAGRATFVTPEHGPTVNSNDVKLATALTIYAASLLSDAGQTLDDSATADLKAAINNLQIRSGSASDQRTAFSSVAAFLRDETDFEIDPDRDLELRNNSRVASGLSLFPALAVNNPRPSQAVASPEPEAERLLDVEVVAIYW